MSKKSVLWICLFGLILRVVYIVFFNPEITFPDEARFWEEALSVSDSYTLRVDDKFAHDMPVTGILLGLVAKTTGHSVVGAKILFAIISAATIYLIAALAYEIIPSGRGSLIAAGISACYPFFIFYSSLLQSETVFLFFVTLFFLQILRIDNRGYWKSGITAGFSHLVRPTLLFFLPVVWMWQKIVQNCSTRMVMIMVLLFTITILPWGLRNVSALGQFHISTTGSGQALWEGNNPWNKIGGVSREFSDPKAYLADLPEGLGELETDEWKKDKAVQYIKDNPDQFLKLAVKKLLRFWNIWPNSPDYQAWHYKVISLLSFGFILLFSVIAIFILRRDFKRLSILYAFFAYYTVIHMITIGSIRYRLPLEPLLIALASAAIYKICFSRKETDFI